MIMMNFKNLIKPKKIESVVQSTATYGKFVAEPYEKGFGITIGNALRRVLLSSIEGSAVVGVHIDGVSSEFGTIPGVQEDVVEILLNIKSLELNAHEHDCRRVTIKKKGVGEVTAADITGDPTVEALHPDQHILTITDDNCEVYIELYVERGIGYVPSEELSGSYKDKFPDAGVDVLPIDAVFTPIKKVHYEVENARVGQSTDYEKLTLEVETDGSVRPEDAIAFAAKIIKDYATQFINFEEVVEQEEKEEPAKTNDHIVAMLDSSIEELELSVRAFNCLRNANIKTLYELCSKTDSEMLKTKNFGRKSLEEIKKVLSEFGLSLGMNMETLGYHKKDEEAAEEGSEDAEASADEKEVE